MGQPPNEFAVDPPATHKDNRFAQRISADSVFFMWLVKFDCIVIFCMYTDDLHQVFSSPHNVAGFVLVWQSNCHQCMGTWITVRTASYKRVF
jgi:hypothetical protein